MGCNEKKRAKKFYSHCMRIVNGCLDLACRVLAVESFNNFRQRRKNKLISTENSLSGKLFLKNVSFLNAHGGGAKNNFPINAASHSHAHPTATTNRIYKYIPISSFRK